MLKRLLAALPLLLLWTHAAAESCVWKVKGENSDVYLAGASHMLRESDYPLPPEYDEAYRNAKKLVFETDFDELNSREGQLAVLKQSLHESGKSLEDELKEETRGKLRDYCRAESIPYDAIVRHKAFMTVCVLTIMKLSKHGASPAYGVDQQFHQRATRDGKPTTGLVPLEEHLEVFALFDEDDTDNLIRHTLRDMENIDKFFNDMLAAWRSGDEEAMDEFFSASIKEEFPELHQKILIDRNKRWLPLIEAMLRGEDNTMVVVGCGHLAGVGSLLDLLRAKGFEIERVEAEPPRPDPEAGEEEEPDAKGEPGGSKTPADGKEKSDAAS